MNEIEDAEAAVRERMRSTSGAPRLELDAATPLETLPREIVALVVGRTQAGLSPLGGDQPRAPIMRRAVLPSAALAVLDAVGLIVSAVAGETVLVVIAAVLFVVLAYIAYSGWRYVRLDPLRVSAAQRAYVDASKEWRSTQAWTDEQRAGPWARLVGSAVDSVERVALSVAWTWASVAPHRAAIELGATLDSIDANAHRHAQSGVADDETLVRRAAALHALADTFDDLVRQDRQGNEVRMQLAPADEKRVGELVAAARDTEPS